MSGAGAAAPFLDAHISGASRGVDVSFTAAPGSTVALIGPNGAGKSTVLEVLAGVLAADGGHATLGARQLFGAAAARPIPAHRRRVALLAQRADLFPHLGVAANVAFGPRAAGATSVTASQAAQRWLDLVEAGDLAGMRVQQLSGGQAQRVALARALAAEPELLLLDEPLAALDVGVAPTLRRMLRRTLGDVTTILVTHDPLDALTLADRIVVLEAGRVAQEGTVAAVLEQPRSDFAAEFAGLTLLRDGFGPRMLGAISPALITLHPTADKAPAGSLALPTIVVDLEPFGAAVRVRTQHGTADLPFSRAAELDLVPGAAVVLGVPRDMVRVYPA